MARAILFLSLTLALFLASAYGADYDRTYWPGLSKGVREKVIAAHSVAMVRCAYTGAMVPSEAVQVDHIVPVAVAWRLGARSWSNETRKEFYNDTDNLVPVLAGVNASKGDKAPRQWMPRINRDQYIAAWRLVCGKYGLNCDQEIGQ